ncbi:MAG: hypothetical protein B7C24_07155 [Bacteroidetes bacterium 4572_77]|nr:MAG: hypothetical protein B7C24_07155 [Bacteroidetes bacterium 4572_77]
MYICQKKVTLQLLKNTKPWSQLFALALIILGLGIFIMMLGILIGSLFVEGPILDQLAQMNQDATKIGLIKYFQIISQIGFFIAPPLFFAFLVDKNLLRFFSMERFPNYLILLLSLVLMTLSNPINDWLIYYNNLIHLPEALSEVEQWMRHAEQKAAVLTNLLLDMHSWKDYVTNLFMIGLLAALGEELLFRGVLQPLFIKIFGNAHMAIWITAFLFSFIHFQFYGFFARMFAGAVLGYLFYYSKNLWIPILAHFFNNAMVVSYVFFTNMPLASTQLEDLNKETPNALYALVSLGLIIAGLYWMQGRNVKSTLGSS